MSTHEQTIFARALAVPHRPGAFPAIACLSYLLVGTLWIWYSDHAGAMLFTSIERLTAFQTYKGALFVGISALFLFLSLQLAYRMLDRLPILERLLRDSRRQYLASVELSPDGVVVHCEGRILHANKRFREMLGIGEEAALQGVPLVSLVRSDEQHLIETQLNRLSTVADGSIPVELTIHAPGGRRVEVEHASRAVRVGNGIVVQTHLRDLGVRNQARRELERVNRELEQRVEARTRDVQAANEALGSFSHSVAHDLRAPVSRVDGFARALEAAMAQNDWAKVAHYIGRIRANAQLMEQMIDGLLKLSRAERAELDIKLVDTRALVEHVVHELLAPATPARVQIGELPAVHVHHCTFQQVWTNLLSNALKYSAGAADPTVRVAAEDRGDELVFSVSDGGIGFDPAEAGNLFGLFQRLPGASGFPGTGIGLTVVRRIVERHGGRVWATGRPGRGATFSFSLPKRN